MQSVLNSNLYVNGILSAAAMSVPPASVGNASVVANANIEATKVQHQHQRIVATPPGSAVTSSTTLIHHSFGAGIVVELDAILTTAPTTTNTVTIDLQRANEGSPFTTMLTAPLVLNNGTIPRRSYSPTLLASALAPGDILQVVVTVTGTSAQGLLVSTVIRENPGV